MFLYYWESAKKGTNDIVVSHKFHESFKEEKDTNHIISKGKFDYKTIKEDRESSINLTNQFLYRICVVNTNDPKNTRKTLD